MNLYAESSAVLTWLLEEPRAATVAALLADAELILTSELTLVECDRSLLRRAADGHLTETTRAELGARVAAAAAHWTLLAIADPILTRARQAFPGGFVRTLEALHLASALEGRAAVSGLALLSLDDRMRKAARALGFEIVPA